MRPFLHFILKLNFQESWKKINLSRTNLSFYISRKNIWILYKNLYPAQT